MKKIGLILCSLVLTGCATTAQDCDPSQAQTGFLTKLNCDLGGGYADSVRQNENRLLSARDENQRFQAIYEQIEAQRQDTNASLAEQKRRNTQLNQSLANLLGQLRQQHGTKKQVEQQITQVEKQLQTAQTPATGQSSAEEALKQEQLQQLQRQLQRLQLSLGYE